MHWRWLITIGIVGVWSGVVAVALRDGPRAASGGARDPKSEAASAMSEAAAARVERRFEVRRAAASPAGAERGRARPVPAASAGDAKQLGVGAGIERIAASSQFSDFAESAGLDEDQRYALARILALHYENERNLAVTDPERKLAISLQRQLLNDTRAQLRSRLGMSDATWDRFERSGLLSAPPTGERSAAPAPGGNPT